MTAIAIHRPTRLLISQAAIAHNLDETRKASHCRFMFLAVKANAYGFGLVEVSRAALNGGADGLAVAVLDEAIELRQAGITAPILIMSLVQPEYAQLCVDNDCIVTVASLDWLQRALPHLTGETSLRISVAVDTGMGRIGYRNRSEIDASLAFMQLHARAFTYYGLMTHFSQSDS